MWVKRILLITGVLAVLLIAWISYPSLAYRGPGLGGETEPLDAAARADAPGGFVKLTDGVTHYELAGPADGPIVVLIHGFSVPSYIWDHNFDALAKAGFRVLRYDLFGRGLSDRPLAAYDLDMMTLQLDDLLAALKIEHPVRLVGLSLGGAIATAFTAQHPDEVDRLALIAPAGMPRAIPTYARIMQTPILGEWLFSTFGESALAGALSGDLRQPERFPEYRQQYLPQLQYPGFRRALLATTRSRSYLDLSREFRQVGQNGQPVLLIWGEQDETVPFAQHELVQAAIPQAQFYPIAGAAHVVNYERPEAVNPLLIDFLRR